MEHTIFGLIKKRGELAHHHKVAKQAADAIGADLDAIDRALVLCGYEDDPKCSATTTLAGSDNQLVRWI
ncbi:MAG: hypothetical protein ACI9KK_000533 [Ascidiaceihabitans sp.]|jgi:hypothetical protein